VFHSRIHLVTVNSLDGAPTPRGTTHKEVLVSEWSVHPQTGRGDPFLAGARHRHACLDGLVYIGGMELDENGDEVEQIIALPCRQCQGDES
jgi:hypothetical protein